MYPMRQWCNFWVASGLCGVCGCATYTPKTRYYQTIFSICLTSTRFSLALRLGHVFDKRCTFFVTCSRKGNLIILSGSWPVSTRAVFASLDSDNYAASGRPLVSLINPWSKSVGCTHPLGAALCDDSSRRSRTRGTLKLTQTSLATSTRSSTRSSGLQCKICGNRAGRWSLNACSWKTQACAYASLNGLEQIPA